MAAHQQQMCIRDRCTPYEVNKGDTKAMVDRWEKRLLDELSLIHISTHRCYF